MKNKILLILALVAVSSGCISNPGQQATITEVVDGDTVKVSIQGKGETVRLLGVDAPETHVENEPGEYENIPSSEEAKRCLKDYGSRASNFVKKYEGKNATVTVDPVSDRRGSYGRLLAYVEVDNRSIGRQLLEKGYARVYDSRFSRAEEYYSIENGAMEDRKGLWKCKG